MSAVTIASAGPSSVPLDPGASPPSKDGDDNDTSTASIDDYNGVTETLPPSHILEDGRFIYLPPPSDLERSRFFERSIARHGLLKADMTEEEGVQEEELKKEEKEADEDKTAPKIHPLAIASARLQSNGLSELNRTINLSQLVSTGEYFGLTNIIDPSLEESKDGGVVPQSIDATKSTYVLKRKRTQFQKASTTLRRHEKRLRAAIKAQQTIDRRLFDLRQQWRLVAPEHGTRARLHAARSTEIVAIDVDVYDRDRVGGGNQALRSSIVGKQQTLAGRLASRVPRFATIELQDNLKFSTNSQDEAMELDDIDKKDDIDSFTRAEPFAIADPTLGKVVENFDPTKVPMLNLQLDIQVSSTGFIESSFLEPLTTLNSTPGDTTRYSQDEDLLVSLQHSLFCASLFESIRSELNPQPENPTQFSAAQRNQPPVAWLSCESADNFLPAPNRVVGGGYGLSPLAVVHCHEGEVKVQLDAETTLCIKLVEANVDLKKESPENDARLNTVEETQKGDHDTRHLHPLCRALLLHAQNVYHQHSLYLRERAKKKLEEEKAKGEGPKGLARIVKEDLPQKARILQNCVSLGAKILFEKKIRGALKRIAKWLKERSQDRLNVEWAALSFFDLHSHFTLNFQEIVMDITIVRDMLTICRISDDGEYRKTQFHSEQEFELHLKMEISRQLKQIT